MPKTFDLAILGSAFGGSLLAMIARRLGRSVVLLERDRHPRFAIGESSTPLANLLLEELAIRYDLPRLLPLTKWGTWRRTHPEIACGLKRGFTFFHHEPDIAWEPRADHANELLVAASPNDTVADTHWYRADFDQFFAREAQALGADLWEQTELASLARTSDGWRIRGTRAGEPVEVGARFIVDASGPRGLLWRQLIGEEAELPGFPARQSLFTHFENVARWDELFPVREVYAAAPPYPADDAALHHVFPGGWMWVLRFNHGLTSAGVSVTDELAAEVRLAEGGPAWGRLLARLPSVARQFASARPVRPFVFSARPAFRSPCCVGEGWALLPSAAGFVDPLFSTGFVLTLLGIERLARLLETEVTPPLAELTDYARETELDLDLAARLLGAQHRLLDQPAAFNSLAMLYFAAASYAESARRLERHRLAPGFLLRGRQDFAPALRALLDRIHAGERPDPGRLEPQVARLIGPLNVAGLCVPAKRNWYACDMADLFAARGKLDASEAEVAAMLRRVGFRAV